MEYYDKSAEYAVKSLSSDARRGLSVKKVGERLSEYGLNKITGEKKKGFFSRLFSALKEPMLIILLFGLAIALGANIGKFLKSGEADFSECAGIFAAIVLSVTITLVMEGSSEKAFRALNRIYDNLSVKAVRDGKTVVVAQQILTVGDVVIIEDGDKIVADGRLIESESLSVDESALTGESVSGRKDGSVVLPAGTPLAERRNCVYSGTFVASGRGKMIVTAVGDRTEIGTIAGELSKNKDTDTPLGQKLSKLGKTVSAVGVVAAILVFVLSAVRLAATGNFNFDTVRELFISCIVLIVAAVPEGLPTVVAVSLALNMIKLARENALIKKMTATETAGAVSVICSDKTGTLTQNKMTVTCVCGSKYCIRPEKVTSEPLLENFVANSSAEEATENGKTVVKGSGTEKALYAAALKAGVNAAELKKIKMVFRVPFTSDRKYMITVIKKGGVYRELLKGAPEKVISRCALSDTQKAELFGDVAERQRAAGRIICFAHKDGETFDASAADGGNYLFDGFAVIADPVRPEVKAAVADCKRAGIKIKMLTGDDRRTAYAVAKELKIADGESGVVNASEIEKLDDEALKKALGGITVIARSTPIVKLRVVRALKQAGEVVAVTGDGINDAPAIKHADVGVAMGRSGSEITKEAADVVLLNDSFATVVKAVAFGRNVYRNIQRFILFQLSVNVSALLFITVTAILGLEPPFNTLQLLWINVIMDGPPALTLGLEPPSADLMKLPPVKRDASIVGKKTLLRIIFNGAFIGGTLVFQYLYNFLGVAENERAGAAFTLFILFQLFNAFNCRELGSTSIFKSAGKNKIMVMTFSGVLLVHFVILGCFPAVFGTSPLSFLSALKCAGTAFSIVLASEAYKLCYRAVRTGGAQNGACSVSA
ncbi:MAG: calcium-translocating P-type ATPase, PMCA-type [Candidatus Borkfalkiaceae bacterium]|nr:calcium-translocating P-type ATPase, PMCA-type [Christensenellaceae bacterium]